jgi:RNA polymerase sigma-70 factor, ECF subfamily
LVVSAASEPFRCLVAFGETVRVTEFEQFYESEYPGIRRALTVALGDVDSAEDAAQEAFVKAWLRWRRVGEMDHPVGWVYVVAVRHALRKRARAARRERRGASERRYADVDLATEITDRLVAEQDLDALAPRQRLAVVLRYHADLSLAEIAAAMGCPLGTVKSTLHAALASLRVITTEVVDERA